MSQGNLQCLSSSRLKRPLDSEKSHPVVNRSTCGAEIGFDLFNIIPEGRAPKTLVSFSVVHIEKDSGHFPASAHEGFANCFMRCLRLLRRHFGDRCAQFFTLRHHCWPPFCLPFFDVWLVSFWFASFFLVNSHFLDVLKALLGCRVDQPFDIRAAISDDPAVKPYASKYIPPLETLNTFRRK